MPEDLYEDFASRYDLFYERFDEVGHTVAAFFTTLVDRHQVRSVLDCACGTGRHLPLFHSLGLEVVGSDVSAAMLAQAQINLGILSLEIPLHRLDYRCLPEQFDRQFDAVTCLSGSLLHMPDEKEVLRALGSMRDVLREGGLLVLAQGTTDKQWKRKPRFLLAVGSPAFSRVFVIDYLGEGARYNILDIFRSDDHGGLEVWSVDYPRVYLRDDQERLLRAAGFRSVSFYGDYCFAPYDTTASDQLITVAEK